MSEPSILGVVPRKVKYGEQSKTHLGNRSVCGICQGPCNYRDAICPECRAKGYTYLNIVDFMPPPVVLDRVVLQ